MHERIRHTAGVRALQRKPALCVTYAAVAVKQAFSVAFWKGDWY